MKINYIILKEDKNQQLKNILKNKLYISSVLLTKLKKFKCITVNEKIVFTNYIVKENDMICVDLTSLETEHKFEDKFKLVNKPLDILYEDEYLLIVNKPSNMPIHPSSKNYENTLSNIVANYLKKQQIYNIHIVTRLDHNTTGICIFAKNSYIQELFVRKKHIINLQKWYLAVVNGIMTKKHDIINLPISRKENTIILREVNEKGDVAKTEYYVEKINKRKNFSIINILLHTGRTHQIRVHMSYIGHTLLGDDLYAKEQNVLNIDKYISRQALHCKKICFNHPITNKYIEIEAMPPEDIQKLINYI